MKYKVGDIVILNYTYKGKVVIGKIYSIKDTICYIHTIDGHSEPISFKWIVNKLDCRLFDVLYY